MEVMPSEYQNIDLTRNEKLFIRYGISSTEYGFILLRVNPSMIDGESMDVVISSQGVIFCKFFDDMTDSKAFISAMTAYSQFVFPAVSKILSEKLIGNKAISKDNKLMFPANIVYLFPSLSRADIENSTDSSLNDFINFNCCFSEDFSMFRNQFSSVVEKYLKHTITPVHDEHLIINDNSINSVLQRIAPEYVTVRVADIESTLTSAAISGESLVIDDKDIVVKAFRLDKEQINIVNKISKDDPNQLILACAGSGKSVLLISKCFKAAQMNPNKKFLITCKNENLHSLYTWFIDRAGLKEKNVECMTFHTLCKKLLVKNGFSVAHGQFDSWIYSAIEKLNNGKIKERYYGIFIDEVQAFEPEWYKFCFNLLENKNTKDHMFVICGDKTQRLDKLKKRGQAPWQVGEGYPSFRGGNKNIRIEKNYRNCIEINEYINRFVSNSKKYLFEIQNDYEIDPDMFLRGQSVTHGEGVTYKELKTKNTNSEIDAIVESINHIHDVNGIPFDEIAVIMYQGKYRAKILGWNDKTYQLEDPLAVRLHMDDIPYCRLYSSDQGWQDHFGETGGVRLIKFQTTLGLDFRAAIICGLEPLGVYDKVKLPNLSEIKNDDELYSNVLTSTEECIKNLYVACTRAKEVLHIIAPDKPSESVFIKILKDSMN